MGKKLATLAAALCLALPACSRPPSCRPGLDAAPDITPDPIRDGTREPDAAVEPDPAPDPRPDLGEVPPIPPIEDDENEKTASEEEWKYVTDLDHTEKVLGDAVVLWGSSRPQVKNLLRYGEGAKAIRFKLVLKPKDAEAIRAQYKVRQTGWYFEWKREILAYRLGKMLHAPVIPAVERKLPQKRFQVFSYKMTEEDYALIKWDGWGSSRGSLRFWVESLHPRKIGARLADEEYLAQIARALHPGNREALLADPVYTVYLEMGRAFVFDYLVLNDDRARNMGTVLSPTGERHIVLIDNGLALGVQTEARKEARGYFEAMTLFPRDTIEMLRAMDEEEIMDLLVPPDDNVIAIRTKAAEQLWGRREAILAHIDELEKKYGDLIWY
jgi:hypothetical protein